MPKTNWDKLKSYSWRERGLLAKSILLLPLVHCALFFPGYTRTVKLIEQLAPIRQVPPAPNAAETLKKARQSAQLVSIAARHGFFNASCLRQALLLWWLLRGQGIQSQIRFGTRKSKDQLDAHAWVEVNGEAISGGEHPHLHYHPLVGDQPPSSEGG